MHCSRFYPVKNKLYINANQVLVNIAFSKQKDALMVLLNYNHKKFFMTVVERNNTLKKDRKVKKIDSILISAIGFFIIV